MFCAGTLVVHMTVHAQPMSVRVEVAEHSMPPLHSYAMGEVGDWAIFFGGISGMGLHSLLGGGAPGTLPPSFPVKVFSTRIIALNMTTGETLTDEIEPLPASVRLALTVTNIPNVQVGGSLLMYGGLGPTEDGSDWDTRNTVTSINLPAVLEALQAGQHVPASAFTQQAAPDGRVAGGIIVRLTEQRYALIGGSLFIGDYAGNTSFLNNYSEKAHLFDAGVSISAPTDTFETPTLHRRDMNALPMTYPDRKNGVRPGFAIAGGVFQNGFFVWENPLYYRDGDPTVTDEYVFIQHMNQYEAGAISFYSARLDENRQVLFGGISNQRYEEGEFVPDILVPWVTDITQIRVQGGVYLDETVVGQTPLPTTNVQTLILPNVPRLENGQIDLDALPANEVRVALLPGGLRAAEPAGAPFTYASGDVYEVYITFGVRGDVTRDGVVNSADLAQLLTSWGAEQSVADLNFDGVVNGADMATLLALWGNSTPG